MILIYFEKQPTAALFKQELLNSFSRMVIIFILFPLISHSKVWYSAAVKQHWSNDLEF